MGGMHSTGWGRCFPVPLVGCPQPGARDFPGHIYHEMINSLFADLLRELEGAEKWIVGWGFFLCVKAVELLCRAVAVNEARPAV